MPVRIQSMTNTCTSDIEATVAQSIRIIEAGAELLRITTPGLKEAKALIKIRSILRKKGYTTPVVADIHFNPTVAEFIAPHVEKIRINPGNFADKKKGSTIVYTDASYRDELIRVEQRFSPLVEICKQHQTAMRIGVNHGSLSDRIISRYGDTPEGMAESAMEFLRICKKMDFHQLVVSMKSSDVKVMIYATRILVLMMKKDNLCVPVHLGVTEAGSETEGRVRSAAGIGPLLLNGIGDTIRVSLTESPESEIPVARSLVKNFPKKKEIALKDQSIAYEQKAVYASAHIGKGKQAVVIAGGQSSLIDKEKDLLLKEIKIFDKFPENISLDHDGFVFFHASADSLRGGNFPPEAIPVVEVSDLPDLQGIRFPLILKLTIGHMNREDVVLRASGIFSYYLSNGIGNGIWIQGKDAGFLTELSFHILQACGLRRTRAEYISCPSCGRTKFDIERSVKEVKAKTSHLSHLKIAVMGCIVNGPGEMSDADYGYIGEGKGKISLFKGKECVKKNVDEKIATQELIEMIKAYDDWKEV